MSAVPARRPDGVRRMLVRSVAMVLLLVPTACGKPSDQPEPDTTEAALSSVKVSGDVGSEPTVKFSSPLRVEESGTRVLDRGDGRRIAPGDQFLLQLTILNASTGETAVSTFDKGQSARLVRTGDEGLFPVLQEALLGKRQGARVLLAATPEDAYADAGAPQYDIDSDDPVLMVADVVAVPPTDVLDAPTGERRTAPKRMPELVMPAGKPVRLRFGRSGIRKPQRLTVVSLITGDGPVVRDDSLVTLDSLGQVWNTRKVVSSTFGSKPSTVAIGTGNVIKAWDQALVGVPRGSRLMVIAPPSLAYHETGSPPDIPGNATVAYIIDVLGVS